MFYYSLILVKLFYISGFSFSIWKVGILVLDFSLSCKTIERQNESEGVALNLSLFACLHDNGCISIFGQELVLWNWVVGYFQQTKIRSVFYIFIYFNKYLFMKYFKQEIFAEGRTLGPQIISEWTFRVSYPALWFLITLYYQCLKYDTQ